MNPQIINSYSENCVLYLQSFEKEIVNQIRTQLDKNKDIKCIFSLDIAKRDTPDTLYKIETNAGFALSGSYGILNVVKEYCRRQEPYIKKFLPLKERLSLSLNFKATEKVKSSEMNTPSTSDNNEQQAFVSQKPLYTFSHIIISEEIRQEINSAINLLRYQDLIYETWGFKTVDPIPKSVLNFYGPPGTGKTMTAHAVAHELGKPLLALNYAEIESKYVGEAPKNLMKAFETAKNDDAVLFFDEADSFLGKRIKNVTQGAEQALNSLRSQMLMLLEQHSGVIIFATNLVSNFDSAFESRILKHIKFELPNKDARIAIIRKMIPSQLPMSSMSKVELEDLSELANGFSGREIKGVILETLLDKASSWGTDSQFEFIDFKNRFEHKKEERKRLKEESQAELKVKIANAINRQVSNAEILDSTESHPLEVSSDSKESTDKPNFEP